MTPWRGLGVIDNVLYSFYCSPCNLNGIAAVTDSTAKQKTSPAPRKTISPKRIAALWILLLLVAPKAPCAAEADFSRFRQAAEYCSGNVKRPFALSPDKRLLCFDGAIEEDLDISKARDLANGGLFVVRSEGGYKTRALALAKLLTERDAVVVVRDYCLSACAAFLVFASSQAFVLKKSIVAWHKFTGPGDCPLMSKALDSGPARLEIVPCTAFKVDPNSGRPFHPIARYPSEAEYLFYKDRLVDPAFEVPPQSPFIRDALSRFVAATRTYHSYLFWTWHPRYYARAIQTKVVYEAYPKGQDEVDYLVLALGLGPIRVLLDP